MLSCQVSPWTIFFTRLSFAVTHYGCVVDMCTVDHVYIVDWASSIKVANPARGQLNREKSTAVIMLSTVEH